MGRVSGGLDELNSILSITQKKINRFKVWVLRFSQWCWWRFSCHGMFCWWCIVMFHYSKTNEIHFLYSSYYELMASTYFVHCLLIFWRSCMNNNWYTACVLCLLAATRNSNPGSSQQTWHAHNIPIVHAVPFRLASSVRNM
jgi:hypothetical protein